MEFTVLSVFAGFVTVLWGMGMYMLAQQIQQAVKQIENLPRNEHELTLSEEIKQQLYDLLMMGIDDSIGALRPPSAIDHAVGAFNAFMQAKLARQMPPNLFEGASELMQEYGVPTQEEINPQE